MLFLVHFYDIVNERVYLRLVEYQDILRLYGFYHAIDDAVERQAVCEGNCSLLSTRKVGVIRDVAVLLYDGREILINAHRHLLAHYYAEPLLEELVENGLDG